MSFKQWLFTVCASLVVFTASISAQPISWLTWYQPEVPKDLRK